VSLRLHAPEIGNFRRTDRNAARTALRHQPVLRKESFERPLLTVQGRYRTQMQRRTVRMYVAFWPVAT
jgi:hypothetical protein